MLSPAFEQAPQAPLSASLYLPASSSSAHIASDSTTSVHYYRPFEHLLQHSDSINSLRLLSSNLNLHAFGLPSPPNSLSSNESHLASSPHSSSPPSSVSLSPLSFTCSAPVSSSTSSPSSSFSSSFSSSHSTSSFTTSSANDESAKMSRARLSAHSSGPAATADSRLLHPLALHYAAQLSPLHVAQSRNPLHSLNSSSSLACSSFEQAAAAAAAAAHHHHSAGSFPLFFASNGALPPARLTTTGPKLSDDNVSEDEMDTQHLMHSNETALNLTGRARSCSPASTGSANGSRSSSTGLGSSVSPQHITNPSLPASFSLLTSSTILGQSPLLSTSVFPPPPTTPPHNSSPESSSFSNESKSLLVINNNNTSSSSATSTASPFSSIGPTLPSRSFSASLQRSHSAPYKPHKWLRPTIVTNSESGSAATSPIPQMNSLSPINSLPPLSPLPNPSTSPQAFSPFSSNAISKDSTIITRNSTNSSSSLISSNSAFCSPLLYQHQQQMLPSLGSPAPTMPAPPPPPQLELRLTRQPAKFHRARYMTEGSRGPIRDESGKSFPAIRLIGFDEHPVPVYCYLSDDRQIAQPHLFYQASKLSSRCVTSCTELRLGGTNALQFELQPSQNMELTIDCLGIVKQRLFEIQQNAAAAGSSSSSSASNMTNSLNSSNGSTNNGCAPLDRGAKSPCCRIVFECYLPKYNHILQTYSDTIHCKQVMRAPEVHRMSSNEASARGGSELFVIGKNFGKDARLLLRLEGSNWQAHAWPEKELLHQTHLVCRLPAIDSQLIRSHGECSNGQWKVQVELYVLCDGKRSAKQTFVYYE